MTRRLLRRPSAGAVPGRWGACLAVRTPPAALLRGSKSDVSRHRRPLAVRHLSWSGQGRIGRSRADPPSVITGRDDLAAGPGDQPGEDPDVDGGLQETHRAVREHDVGPAGVEAVDFPVVRAIDGASPEEGGPVRRGAPAPQQVSRGPGAAGQPDVRDLLAPLPQLRPARAFGDQDRVGGAVQDVRQAPGVVDREDALVMPRSSRGPPGGSIRPARTRPASTTLMPA